MARFQLILPVANQNVTKNLTCHRMHIAGPQIYQINSQTNSLENMYYVWYAVGNNWPFGQENRFCAKKTPQNRLFWWTRTGLPDFGRPLTANGWHKANFRFTPWKLGGMTIQIRYVGGWWHQHWAHTSTQHLFSVVTRKFVKKIFFWSQYPRNPHALRIQKT